MKLYKTALAVMLAIAPLVGFSEPAVKYVDTVSGPIAGGENNKGAYLSIYGTGFGDPSGLGTVTKVFIGGVEVDNYRYLGPAKVADKLGLQEIRVQVGSLPTLELAHAYKIKVKVNNKGKNSDESFTPCDGQVLFVSLTGDDRTAVPNDIGHPYRYLQDNATGRGAYSRLKACTQVVVRGGTYSDVNGQDGTWIRFGNDASKNGTKKAWIHFTSYPNETVHYINTSHSQPGGFQGPWSAIADVSGKYVAFSGFQMEVQGGAASDAAPFNSQYGWGPWRVVNNEIGPWVRGDSKDMNAAGFSGGGTGTQVLGNYIHDIEGTPALQNHGIYSDSGASKWKIAYNVIYNISSGNLIQFYDSVGAAGNNYDGYPPNWQGFTDIEVSHNWLELSGKYGLNLADSSQSMKVFDNVITRANLAGVRINTVNSKLDMTIAFNTIANNQRSFSGSGNGQVVNTWGGYDESGDIRFIQNILASGADTYPGTPYYENDGTDKWLSFTRNIYWNGTGDRFTRDPLAIIADPLFVDPNAKNYQLQPSSPARHAATQTLTFPVLDDILGNARPEVNSDLGAYNTP